jgi:hypothetical protein
MKAKLLVLPVQSLATTENQQQKQSCCKIANHLSFSPWRRRMHQEEKWISSSQAHGCIKVFGAQVVILFENLENDLDLKRLAHKQIPVIIVQFFTHKYINYHKEFYCNSKTHVTARSKHIRSV